MELLERFALGDMDALEALFRQYQADVYRWMMRIVRDHAVAEDLTMEAFWRAYKAHASFEPSGTSRGNFGAWLRRIATNLAIDHLRQASRYVPLAADESHGDSQASFERAVASSELAQPPSQASAANPAIRGETRDQIESAFRALPPKLRLVARLSLLEEVSHAEIAEALDISEGAVRVRVHRATQQLRETLRHMGARP
jgi:RNA polymerase sigma-70 factor (ECF subfamily)